MMRSRPLLLLGATCALVVFAPSCDDGFGSVRGQRRLEVELQDREAVSGERLNPLPLTVDDPKPLRVIVRALRTDGSIDSDFNGFVRLSAKPGAIEPLSGPDTEGRNVKLVQGESRAVDVRLVNAYGTTYILADDLGYVPVDPLSDPPPKCADGIDNDGDGRVDFPADDGCAFANDDSEEGATYAQGASTPIFFSLPRIADIRGLRCQDPATCSGTGATPYPKEQIQVDTGYHDKRDPQTGELRQEFDFSVVVSRISSDGFYATDVADPRNAGFTSIFSFNFNAPPRMRVCDRLKTFGGTATEFFGFTQISYPTWTLEEWDPRQRRCLVPDVEPLSPSEVNDNGILLRLSGGLVRVETTAEKRPGDPSSRDFVVRVTPKFGPGDVPRVGAGFAPGPDATNCDFNKDGRIDFALGSPEGECSNACTQDKECTEYSNYLARRTFRLTVTDANQQIGAIQADASTTATFDPLAMKGKELRSFSGTLHFFSGGAQYTIEARCSDDIVVDLGAQPLGQDRLCSADADCAGYNQGALVYTCQQLPSGEKACRSALLPNGGGFAPPPLACVFPRTILDNNPE